jgi:hypothetical protein
MIGWEDWKGPHVSARATIPATELFTVAKVDC